MSDNPVFIFPVLAELRKEVLVETYFDPWVAPPERWIGLAAGEHENDKSRCLQKHRGEISEGVLRKRLYFASLTKCPNDAKFYKDVEEFLNITYCWRHVSEAKLKFDKWKARRTNPQESTGPMEPQIETNHDLTSSQHSISASDSDTQSQDSSSLFETALVSPNDTQLTTPDFNETLEVFEKLELYPKQEVEIFETGGSNDNNTKTASEEVSGKAKATDDESFSPKELNDPSDAESQQMLEQLKVQGTDQKTAEHSICHETILHDIHQNLGLDDKKSGIVVVLKKRLKNQVVMKVDFSELAQDPLNDSGNSDATDSEIVYQSTESFPGASKVVNLVKATLSNEKKVTDILDHGRVSDDWFMVSQAEMILAAQIYTAIVRSLPVYVDDEPSDDGPSERDLIIKSSPGEAVKWLEKLEIASQNVEKGGSGSNLEATEAPSKTIEILREILEIWSMKAKRGTKGGFGRFIREKLPFSSSPKRASHS